tara:strand:+ start:1392 stop:1643 length:252 start_codon:yes stop_codon:yes gene_type:complete
MTHLRMILGFQSRDEEKLAKVLNENLVKNLVEKVVENLVEKIVENLEVRHAEVHVFETLQSYLAYLTRGPRSNVSSHSFRPIL